MTIVTVADAKAHMNITEATDDTLIAGKIAAAEEWIGAFIGTPLAAYETCPAPLLEAVRQLTAELYENREASLVGVSASEIPFGVHHLITPYREWTF